MTKQDTWDSWGGISIDHTPVPAGQYFCEMREGKLEFDHDGMARTSFTFVILDGDHANRYLWLDYPHLIKDDGSATFGFLARMMWEACGLQGMPEGGSAAAMLLTIARSVIDCRGRNFKLTTGIKTWLDQNGQKKSKSQVRKVEAIAHSPVAASAPQGDAPQW